MAYNMGDNMDGEYLDGPIIQPIPDNLMVGDYIEINGFCRGQEVIVELLTDPNAGLKDTGVLPLRILLQTGGRVQVMSQNLAKVQKQENFVKNGIQNNLAFELCIYALEDGYDIKLNNERVCHVAHLVNLENVGAISMDGDADFTSIEFKDVFGEEDDGAYPPEDTQPGIMRVQEFRQSSIRRNAPPVFVRSSTRRSQRSNPAQSPAMLAKSHWDTSADLTRPELDIDKPAAPQTSVYANENVVAAPSLSVRNAPSRESLGYDMQRSTLESDFSKSKPRPSLGGKKSINLSGTNLEDQYVVGSTPSSAIAGEAHRGSYYVLDDEAALRGSTQPAYTTSIAASTPNLTEKTKKKRSSWLIGKSKKSGGSETDLQGSYVELEKKKKGSIRDLFRRKKSTPTTSVGDVRSSVSMPNVSYPDRTSRALFAPGEKSVYFGAAADRSFVRGPIPGSLLKEPAPQIAAYVAAQKAVPEFENFSLTSEQGIRSPPSQTYYSEDPRKSTTMDDGGYMNARKLKGSAPQVADVLFDQGRAGFDHEATLTGQLDESIGTVQSSRVSTIPSAVVQQPVSKSTAKKLKGPAPEMAATVEDRYGSLLDPEIQLTADSGHTPAPSAPTSSGIYVNTVQKIKGPAPEIASQLKDANSPRSVLDDNYTLSGDAHAQKPTELIQSRPVKETVYQKPVIDTDFDTSHKVQTKPVYDTPIQAQPVYVPQRSEPKRPASAGHVITDDDLSDVSTVHSDQEYYLEVGRSNYYMERKKSLKRYRSRRAIQKEREARQSMGLSRQDSQRSSISSLKPDDPVLIPRKRMGTDKTGVHSWLNGQANDYGYETSRERARVYAAPSTFTKPVFAPNLTIDATQMKSDDYKAELPLPLDTGRSATVKGQFLNVSETAESCSILLTGQTGEESTLLLELWSDGRLDVYGLDNHKPVLLLRADNSIPVIESEFTIHLYNRNETLAITVRDWYTVFVPSDVAPSKFTFVSLEPCKNAILTHLSVSNTLSMPLTLKYPKKVEPKDSQTLSFDTKLMADSKIVTLTFIGEEANLLKVVLDFLEDATFIQFGYDSTPSRYEIPFVPEQIRKIIVEHQMEENVFIIKANKKELLILHLPVESPFGSIQKAVIEGDLLVFNTTCE